MKGSFLCFTFFPAILITLGSLSADDDSNTTPPCKLESSVFESDAEHYLAYKITGKINDVYTDSLASTAVVDLVGFGSKSLQGAQIILYESFFEDYPEETVAVMIYADPTFGSNTYYQTGVTIAVPKSRLNYMKRNNINVLPFAPDTYLVDIVFSKDGKYSKQCIIAVGRHEDNEDFGDVSVGSMQVCHEDNSDFSAGEYLKIAMNVELAVGEELLAMYEESTTYDELCSCFEDNYYETDCSDDIEWESNYTVEPEEDEETPDSSNEENDPENNGGKNEEDDSANEEDEPVSDSEDITPADEENTDDSDKETDKKEEKKSDGCSMIFV